MNWHAPCEDTIEAVKSVCSIGFIDQVSGNRMSYLKDNAAVISPHAELVAQFNKNEIYPDRCVFVLVNKGNGHMPRNIFEHLVRITKVVDILRGIYISCDIAHPLKKILP